MTKRFISGLALILLIACFIQGLYIYHLRKLKIIDPWHGIDSWASDMRKNIAPGQLLPVQDFDKLFNDNFFQQQSDPFKEVTNFSQKIASHIQADQQALMNESWAQWFHKRMDIAEIHPQISSTPHQIIVTMNIPRLKKDSLKVDVNENRVRLFYQVGTQNLVKDSAGHVTETSNSLEEIEKIMPLPNGANPATWHVIRQPDAVKIVFEKTN